MFHSMANESMKNSKNIKIPAKFNVVQKREKRLLDMLDECVCAFMALREFILYQINNVYIQNIDDPQHCEMCSKMHAKYTAA